MNITPLPNVCKSMPGVFRVEKDATINYSQELKATAEMLSDYLEEATGHRPERSPHAPINLTLDFSLDDEQYQLFIDQQNIHLAARTDRGAFYGLQSLKQLMTIADGCVSFACGVIDDRPRFPYRGVMLDVARHFFPKEEVLRLIELIAFHKFNFLHLHLSDDQGWRVEIASGPLLTEIGSSRRATYSRRKGYSGPHRGYYTQAELKEIVAHARRHHIEVIPEIDMPGHMNALIAAHPDLSCLRAPIGVRCDFGISPITLCPGCAEVYPLLSEIIRELVDIFDGPYFHLGGDEAPKKHWKKCPRCQKAIRDHDLKNEKELQAHFLNYFAELLRTYGKTPIIWNDGVTENIDPDAILQHWKFFTRKKTIREINSGRKAIISDYFHLYLDLPYAAIPLRKTYSFDPLFHGIKYPDNVLGIEATLWTEWISDRQKADFHLFPRLSAAAEVAWTERENKSYDDFISRLTHLYGHYRKMNIGYAEGRENYPNLPARLIGLFSWFKDEDWEMHRKKRRTKQPENDGR